MSVWLIGLFVGLVGIGFALKRVSSARTIDAGEVSEGWLREQRAEKQDRFPS